MKKTIIKKSGYEATVMPKYNPYQTGHGVWQTNKKPSRAKQKSMDRKEIKNY